MIIGIDDTDSRDGMCTTYLCSLLSEELERYGKITDDLLLIRLNPTVPYKTRGNAAVAIAIDTDAPDMVKKHVTERVRTLACLENDTTNPGIVFVSDEMSELSRNPLGLFFKKAVKEIITVNEAEELIRKLNLQSKGFKNRRGLIGALAACGAMLNSGWDHTYEYITYRKQEKWGSPRMVDSSSIFSADKKTYPMTWDNVDILNQQVVCVPRSPDPVLYGIRGSVQEEVIRCASMIRSEPFERSALYKTNQGTDMHIIQEDSISQMQDMHSYSLMCTVISVPETIQGGHVIFSVSDKHDHELKCAAYEPTKNFRELVRELIPGDVIRIYGSMINGTLNTEKLEIISMIQTYEYKNPACPVCHKSMESAGKGQGYRCRKCRTQAESKIQVEICRNIHPGLYEVPPCARRHLAKPLIRDKNSSLSLFPSR
ncbi:domain of unknown function DUF1743 [Methanosalsum zhilinae DSM 4017]|uniref:tRNA(Ile2) 2-agmatinylcytidine synthetase TiaS n=1 Tax=Methanosalsum zhilinae (strain DSM 4017 / NBRC 107636 / OCM 62 / WeN5) TaxID=679901 RepID=F7XMS2_METZD|nr:tRNA(Ile)(2)-agmatinylcytidine synthase [Methanosalsum zhilinae]AEH59939.1 domain of unknown function DUF1743 [Methanosalsum zhilinae DSM 4017]